MESYVPLQHEYHMWMPANIRMDRHWEAEIIIIPVEEIKMVPPKILNVLRIDPAMGVWCLLNEHHGRNWMNLWSALPYQGNEENTLVNTSYASRRVQNGIRTEHATYDHQDTN